MSKSAREIVAEWIRGDAEPSVITWTPEKAADAILAALREAGYKLAGPDEVVMPVEPTAEIVVQLAIHDDGDMALAREGQRRLGLKVVPPSYESEMAYAKYKRALSAAPSARPDEK